MKNKSLGEEGENVKSSFFKISEHFGGGITSIEEITDVLEFLVSKKVFEKRLEKNGEYSYKEAPGVNKEDVYSALKEFESLASN